MVFSVGDLVEVLSRNNAVGCVIRQSGDGYYVIYYGKTVYGHEFAVTDNFNAPELKLVEYAWYS